MSQQQAFIKFSPRILDHLGLSAYNSLPKSLAELSANSYDADASEVRITLPDALNEHAVIEIEDNGVGMSADDLQNKFLFIGRNKRLEGQRTAKGRLIVGSKGIGKLAGFGIARRVEITTWSIGGQSTVLIDRHSLEDLAALSECPFTITSSPSAHGNGTKVRLLHLNPDLQTQSTHAIRRQLYRALPKQPGFTVYVNDVECTAEDVEGVRHDFDQQVAGLGRVNGFYTIATSRQPNPGLAVRVRGRIVQEPSLFGLDTRTHGFFTAEKVIGEVNAEFLDPENAAEGARDLINTARNGFIEDAPTVSALNDWAKGFLQQILLGIDETETKRRTDNLLASPEVRQRLERMPPHVRHTATQVVRALVRRLRNVADEEAAELVEWVLRYFESNILRELMKAIIAADVKDAEKLAVLVQEWGLKQVTSVTDLIKTQIDIIVKLEELVASDVAKEIDLHKLIEANLWLIQEGLELWSSDKPLKEVLEKQLDVIYKNKADLRPDLVCRSRDGGNDAVVLEFKRPKEKVLMEHVTQALEYTGLLKKHRPNIHFRTYIVGRTYDSAVLASRDNLVGLHLWSFSEILQRARMRFEEILKILGRA
jgi:hypothetical protein